MKYFVHMNTPKLLLSESPYYACTENGSCLLINAFPTLNIGQNPIKFLGLALKLGFSKSKKILFYL